MTAEAKEFNVYEWAADLAAAVGLSHEANFYRMMAQEPRLDPRNNRVIRLARKPVEPSQWQRVRRMLTPSRPGPTDVGGCLVALGLIVGAFLLGRLS